MINIETNLKKHNILIPTPAKPVANYSPYTISKDLIFISGQIPIIDGNIIYKGKVNKDLSINESIKAAELCMLNSFAILISAVNQNLNQIKKCIKINVFINSDSSFVEQPRVADGASNLISKIMEPNISHARSAVSVNALPKDAAVEIDTIFEISLGN
tara:strand:- start:115 stop:588 length:474 start_codon:yes stop_codon:yes gene_type:complete